VVEVALLVVVVVAEIVVVEMELERVHEVEVEQIAVADFVGREAFPNNWVGLLVGMIVMGIGMMVE